ncbi:MAG: HD-like signal output (HDOD) protein [Desulforhopalus sp.]|jgi:HD-like signal output (HDOD) protein
MSQLSIQTIYDQIDNLPALPATVTRVLTTIANPESSASDLMQVVLPDQTMCATILKMANSAAFGIPKEVSTIERALMVLGFDEIKNIVIGKAIFASFPKLGKESIKGVGVFWEHAFTCALMSKIIGEHYRLSASELFICGLIHDIGKLVMLMAYPNSYPILGEHSLSSHFQTMGSETEQYGINHDAVGLELAIRWSLPEQLTSAIGYHHKPDAAPHFKQHPMIVQVADILSLMYCCSEITEAKDVQNIFYDFLPGTTDLWKQNGLTLQPETLGLWYETLQETREKDQEMLTLLSA